MAPIKILLVDDHQIMIDGILSIIEDEETIEVLGQASTGKEAIDLCAQLKPDLVLMDLDMPVMNGMDASKEIKTIFPEIKIIILSLHAEKSVLEHMIQINIDGYLIKTSSKSEMLLAIKTVGEGKRYFSSTVTLSLSSNSKESAPIVDNSNQLQAQLASLSEREIEILKLIAEGFSNKEIGEQLHLSFRTIDAHRANLMRKLEIKKVTGLVRFAVKTGIVS